MRRAAERPQSDSAIGRQHGRRAGDIHDELRVRVEVKLGTEQFPHEIQTSEGTRLELIPESVHHALAGIVAEADEAGTSHVELGSAEIEVFRAEVATILDADAVVEAART